MPESRMLFLDSSIYVFGLWKSPSGPQTFYPNFRYNFDKLLSVGTAVHGSLHKGKGG